MVQIDAPPSAGESGTGEDPPNQNAGPNASGTNRARQQVAVGRSSIDSQAITEEAITAPDGSTLGTAESTPTGFAPQDDVSSDGNDALSGGPMPPAWQSERTKRSRQIGLVVAVSISSLIAAIAGFGWFVQSWRNQDANTVAELSPGGEPPVGPLPNTDADLVEQETGEEEAAETGNSPDSIATSDQSSDDTSNSSDPSRDPAQDAVQDRDPAGNSIPGDTEGTDNASQDDAAMGTREKGDNGGAETAPPSTDTEPPPSGFLADLIPRSPLDPPPAQPPQDPANSEPGEAASGMRDLPPALAEYTKFLLEEGSAEEPTLETPPSMNDVRIDEAAEVMDDPTITVRPREVNVKADLAIRMAIDTKGYPLPDLALLISQVSGVPIQIDWVSFDLAGIDLSAPVTTPQGWQSARTILEAVGGKLGAELREEGSVLVITLSEETFAQKVASITDLSDFGDGAASAKQVLIDFLRSDSAEVPKEIPVGSTRQEQQIAAIATDTLRRMRGIAPKVDDGAIHRWAWSSDDPSGEWKTLQGGDPGPQPHLPMTMSDFLRKTSRRNGALTLINWFDFGKRNVSPVRVTIPHVEEDAGSTLNAALEPLGLQVRQVDATHWWIGRESTYDRLPALIWTPPLGANRDTFVEGLSQIMNGASRDAYRISVDPDSGRALILLPRFIVRQLGKVAGGVALAENQ